MRSVSDLRPGDLFTLGKQTFYDLRREPSIYESFDDRIFCGPLLFITRRARKHEQELEWRIFPNVKLAVHGWLAVNDYWHVNIL